MPTTGRNAFVAPTAGYSLSRRWSISKVSLLKKSFRCLLDHAYPTLAGRNRARTGADPCKGRISSSHNRLPFPNENHTYRFDIEKLKIFRLDGRWFMMSWSGSPAEPDSETGFLLMS